MIGERPKCFFEVRAVDVRKIGSGEVYLKVRPCVPRQKCSAQAAHLVDGEREAALDISFEVVRVGRLGIARCSARCLPSGIKDGAIQHGRENC